MSDVRLRSASHERRCVTDCQCRVDGSDHCRDHGPSNNSTQRLAWRPLPQPNVVREERWRLSGYKSFVQEFP